MTTSGVNMRIGPSTSYAKVATLPAGARLWIGGNVNGWYQVSYNGLNGFVTGSRVTTMLTDRGPRSNRRGPAPQFGYMQRPWWDNQRQAWYDGHRWYRNGVWHNDPTGFSFGFSFGG